MAVVSATVGAEGARLRQWSFEATRARGELSRMLGGGKGTTLVSVTVRQVDDVAVVDVDGEPVARVRCLDWWIWLSMHARRADFSNGRVRMCQNDMGLWFMIEGWVAPTVLGEAEVDSIMCVLRDVRGG